MALLSHAAGRSCVFCFHDDNFLMPKPEASLARVRAIRQALDDFGVGRAGMIGKCRPDSLTAELALDLRRLGLIRLYVGVENASEPGAVHLNRGTQTRAVHQALKACRDAGIFVCYNLLLFEPKAHLDDIRANIDFIRAHANHPVNFCRAEPYHGTPLQRSIDSTDSIGGSYLGWDYCSEDDRAELMFRICAAAFRQRNFDPKGVHNRYMGVGYSLKLLEYFYDDTQGRLAELADDARHVTRSVALDTADFLEQAWQLAHDVDLADHDQIARMTALLGLKIAAADRIWHVELDRVYRSMNLVARGEVPPEQRPRWTKKLSQAMQNVALGTWLTLSLASAGCDSRTTVGADAGRDITISDPPPPDAGKDVTVVDMVPPDKGVDAIVSDPPPPDAGKDVTVVDMLPPDKGVDLMVVDPPPPPDFTVVDMLPPDKGVDGPVIVPDPVPPDGGQSLVSPQEGEDSSLTAAAASVRSQGSAGALIDKWTCTSPRQAQRSNHLPLFDAPTVALRSEQIVGDPGAHAVYLVRKAEALSFRWEGDGEIDGDGDRVVWRPSRVNDQLRVAIRSQGGVTVLALRAEDLG
jgi:hypothetical protein